MAEKAIAPVGVRLTTDIEYRPDRPNPYRARVRWFDPATKRRLSLSEGKADENEAQEWLQSVIEAAEAGLSPSLTTMKLAEYGNANMDLALRGLELKTLVPYLSGWRMRVAPARVTGWQKLYKQAEDELLDPRALALPDWETLVALADALVAASHDEYRGWGEVVIFAACTAARIGESSGCRVGDIDTTRWVWTVRRPTTPAPGGLTDKGTKGKRARKVPIVEEIRPLVAQRYLHPDVRKITAAGAALSAHFNVQRAPRSLPGPIVMTR
ncbi:hypothetical protein ACH4FV_14635 [Streptomyces anulatus]|uniref:hypothetical protein n=1 Tax=Streptomyces anulatus TaxID=1892 RepID=UPI0030E0D955